jgi:hypothetical protein
MILLIVAGLVYTVWAESIAVAIVTAAMILYRAQRPSPLMRRIREAWLMRQVAAAGEEPVE